VDAPGEKTHSLTVDEGATGRLDRFIATSLDLSRTRVQGLLAEGRVTVDGRVAKKSDPASPGTKIQVVVPPAQPVDMLPEEIPLDVVFEDAHLAVVNKAAGMVVHPAPGHRTGTLVNALLWRMPDIEGVGGRLRPGIVHRLDRDTSGLLVVAKTDLAHRTLSDALRRRRVKRLYLALAWGHLKESPLTIEAPIGRDRKNRKKMAVVQEGRSAMTRVRVRERLLRADLLDVALKTGRTHQIRVHLAYAGHPVVGDSVYGDGWERGMGGPTRHWAIQLARSTPRQFLHAQQLSFDHPISGERLSFTAPLPPDLAEVAAWARGTTGSQNPA